MRFKKRLRAGFAIGLLAWVGQGDAQAQTSIMKLDGIEGDFGLNGFEGWTVVTGYATAVGVPVTVDAGGPQFGTIEFRPIEVTKPSDQTDADLFARVVDKATIADGCLLTYSDSGQSIRKISAIGMENVAVANLSPAATEDGFPQQSISLDYGKISMIVYTYDSETGQAIGQNASCWDRIANKSCGDDLLGCPAN